MRLSRDILVLLLLAAVPAIGAAFLHPRAPSFWAEPLREGEVAALDTALTWGDDVIWLDARSAAAFNADHILGAMRLNENEWDALLPDVLRKWEDGRPIVVYCDSAACSASAGVAKRLREQVKLSKVYVLHDGWQAWKSRPQ